MEKISKEVGKRIKYFRNQKGLTQKELGAMLGVAPNTVTGYERGISEPNQETIFKISNILDITINDLFPPIKNAIALKVTKNIPIIGSVACGEPILADENIIDTMAFPAELLPFGELFFLKAVGDSMEPVIRDGSLVLIRKQDDVENGEIGAILFNDSNEATLKKIKKIDNVVLLEPINPNYESFLLNKDNPARIIGKAVKVLNDL